MNSIWFFVILFGPIPALILYLRIRRVIMRRLAGTPSDVPAIPKPFNPEPELTPGPLLRRFTPLQRFYLRQQVPTARMGFVIATWILFAITVSSLLPASVNRYGLEPPLAQRVWYSFLHNSFIVSAMSSFVAVITAITAAFNIAGAPTAAFYRTRPLSYRLLFWGRILPAVLTMLAAYATAILSSLLLLVAIYGPVWKHLFIPGQHLYLSKPQADHFIWILRASAWRTFSAIGLSMVLAFSSIVLLVCQPYLRKTLPKPITLGLGLGVFELFSVFSGTLIPRLSGATMATNGSHPALQWFVLFTPMFLSVAILYLAQTAASRTET